MFRSSFLVKELRVSQQKTELTNKTRQNNAHQHTEAAIRGAILEATFTPSSTTHSVIASLHSVKSWWLYLLQLLIHFNNLIASPIVWMCSLYFYLYYKFAIIYNQNAINDIITY